MKALATIAIITVISILLGAAYLFNWLPGSSVRASQLSASPTGGSEPTAAPVPESSPMPDPTLAPAPTLS